MKPGDTVLVHGASGGVREYFHISDWFWVLQNVLKSNLNLTHLTQKVVSHNDCNYFWLMEIIKLHASDKQPSLSKSQVKEFILCLLFRFRVFSRAASLSGATYLVTMVSVWMYVRQLCNRKINHILTYTKEFFLTADLAWPKLTAPPPRQNQTKYLLISTIS